MKFSSPKSYKIRLEYLKPLINEIISTGIENHYHTFEIPKRGRKGWRTICAPDEKLKYIQHQILNQLIDNEELFRNNAATGFNPGTSIKINALRQIGIRQSKQKDYINTLNLGAADNNRNRSNAATVKMDLANAFDSIGISMLDAHWPKLIEISKEDKELLLNICTLNGSLPQGAPTSPILLNIALYSFDRECIRLLRHQWKSSILTEPDDNEYFNNLVFNTGPIYTRYADDISVSFDRTILKPYWIIQIIKKISSKYGLTIKDSKTRYMTVKHGRFVTGLNVVNRDHVSVPRKVRQKIRAAIYEASNTIDEIKFHKLKTSILGRINHVYSIDMVHGVQLLRYAIKLKVFKDTITIAKKSYKDLEKIITSELMRRQNKFKRIKGIL